MNVHFVMVSICCAFRVYFWCICFCCCKWELQDVGAGLHKIWPDNHLSRRIFVFFSFLRVQHFFIILYKYIFYNLQELYLKWAKPSIKVKNNGGCLLLRKNWPRTTLPHKFFVCISFLIYLYYMYKSFQILYFLHLFPISKNFIYQKGFVYRRNVGQT